MPCSAALLVLALASGAAWTPAAPGHRWEFPADHWTHPGYRNEWWYFTGTLSSLDDPGRRFGYQLTFFRVGLSPQRPAAGSAWAAADVLMGHAAVTDIAAGRHVFSEVLWRAIPLLSGFGAPPDPVLAWSRAPPGTDACWELRLAGEGFALSAEDASREMAIRLDLVPTRPPVLQGPGGLSRKSGREGYASLYYSLTRLATEGTVTAGGRVHRVRGESWMDRELGSSQLAPDQSGWDWFGLRLADGRDLMLYVLRGKDGAPDFRSGTLVDGEGRPRWMGSGDVAIRATGRWRSPVTGAEYPAGWEVEVASAGLSLRVEPEVSDQENRGGAAPFYWEGAVRVLDAAGRRVGEGHVELTGYGEGNRPPI